MSDVSARATVLDAKIPPPLVMLATGAAMWAAAAARLLPDFALPLRPSLAAGLAVLALAIELAAAWRFLRLRTTVNPLAPERATRLVVDGLNRCSRNPMYLGQALLLLAWGVWLAHPLAFALIAIYPAWITRFQILPEERALAARFGADYAAYRARVRRWL